MSNFLEFYEKYGISPVSQDIGDIDLHFSRRIGLYRTLGIPPLFFKGRDVLEVAPGSGYNSIVTATFDASGYDLVEPNSTGFNKMVSLFEKFKIKDSGVSFFNCRLEDFARTRKYDIVLCEGLIPGLNNQHEFVLDLAGRVKSGGVMVVTCADVVSLFFETMRRYLSRILTWQLQESGRLENNKKDTVLLPEFVKAFKPHLATLSGMSRPAEDWVYDVLLNPAASSIAEKDFSIERCLDYLGGDFWFYGSSPNFLSHLGWYKEIEKEPQDFNKAIIKSFKEQHHILLHYQETGKSNLEANERLAELCMEFTRSVDAIDILHPAGFPRSAIERDLAPIREMADILQGVQMARSGLAMSEYLRLFEKGSIPSAAEIAGLKEFRHAFGRGQQYLSMIRA